MMMMMMMMMMIMNLHECETSLSAKNSPCGRNVEGWVQVRGRIRVRSSVVGIASTLRAGLPVFESR